MAYWLGAVLCGASIVAYPIYDAHAGDQVLPFSVIGDMDKMSKDGNLWYSPMAVGTLALNANRSAAFVNWYFAHNYTSLLNYANRGMELSDLKYFNGKLMTVDDKTGIIHWIHGGKAIPWVILMDGDGDEEIPFKGEWLTVKDDFLYCGSTGNEKTTASGDFLNNNAMFVKRWFFLPRHLSKLAYSEATVDETGANVLLSANEDFTDTNVIAIGQEVHTRGFSAFQFVPRTNHTIIAALKTEELRGEPFVTYLMVFTITGRIFLNETMIPGTIKYEGIEFLFDEKP